MASTANLLYQCLIGMQCNDFAIVAADKNYNQSILVMKDDLGDIAQFTQFVVRNMKLYSLRNGYQLDTAAAVHFTRTNMADVLRTGKGGELYTVDFLASCVRLPFAAHGFAGQLSVGILSQYYRPDLREEEAYKLIKLCVREIHRRLIINLPNFGVKSISKDGIKILPPIRPASFDK
ncbi:unnamed protein product [Leptidea sinapis]|uniref:Proteasome subunit beta n=1 Tax=Leptidea sinapis TaxID=189913 RepID=A0A5E4QZ05_9NEOP|nr:unnamed protein product [Leptidea sinapis]